MLQEQRFAGLGKLNLPVTGDMGSAEVQQFCRVDEQGKCLLRRAAQQMGLSAAGVSLRYTFRVLGMTAAPHASPNGRIARLVKAIP